LVEKYCRCNKISTSTLSDDTFLLRITFHPYQIASLMLAFE
jgi:hypothetical protein